MRTPSWAIGAALLCAMAGAEAQEVDCNALRRSNVSFQVTYANWPLASNGEIRPAIVEQHHRRDDGGGRRLVRTVGEMQVTKIETRHNFATRVRAWAGGQEVEMVLEIEGLALDRDHFAGTHDFVYVRRVQQSTGRRSADENRARFRGEETMTVSGCTFRVLAWDVERRNLEPLPGEPTEAVESFWYAPELRGFLRFQGRVGDRITFDRRAASIETRFEPFE